LAHRTALRIVDRNDGSGIVDEQLFAGAVFLAQHHVQLTPPLLVGIAESTVAVSVWVCLSILFPYQLQRQVGMLLEFFMDAGQIRLWLTVLIDPPHRPTEQSFFQLPVIPSLPATATRHQPPERASDIRESWLARSNSYGRSVGGQDLTRSGV
jgi:hypothetical protein